MMVNNKYRIVQELGQGTFGKVYQAVGPRDTNVAIKYDTSHLGMLQHEATMLNYLHQRQCNTKNIPKILWYGCSHIFQRTKKKSPDEYGKSASSESDPIDVCGQRIECPCLVIPYYDCTLSTYIIDGCRGSPSEIQERSGRTLFGRISNNIPENDVGVCRNITRIVQSMLSILEAIHQVYVIHRDLKPENFMWKNGQIYLIDFGLSTFFVDGDTGGHIPINTEPKHDLVGSSLYASIHVHRGYKASRRDDCIQLGYIWLYMVMGGRLPWSGASGSNLASGASGSNLASGTDGLTSDISPMNLQHPTNRLRYYQKQNILAKLDNYSQIQEYLVHCYALEYDAKPTYTLLDV